MKNFKKILGIVSLIVTITLAVIEFIRLINIGVITEANPLILVCILIMGASITTFCLFPMDRAVGFWLLIAGLVYMCYEIYMGNICWEVARDIAADISNTTFGWIRIISGSVVGGTMIVLGALIVKGSYEALEKRSRM